ncbi:MAG: hypothetical protein SVR81_09155 [Chloroflexota bacterium]|nr:hypothetical protein [Chloroflexota bacterium]
MAAPLHRQTIALIVRVWAEYLDDQSTCWRGVIDSPQSDEVEPFTSLDEMTQIIQREVLSVISTTNANRKHRKND